PSNRARRLPEMPRPAVEQFDQLVDLPQLSLAGHILVRRRREVVSVDAVSATSVICHITPSIFVFISPGNLREFFGLPFSTVMLYSRGFYSVKCLRFTRKRQRPDRRFFCRYDKSKFDSLHHEGRSSRDT